MQPQRLLIEFNYYQSKPVYQLLKSYTRRSFINWTRLFFYQRASFVSHKVKIHLGFTMEDAVVLEEQRVAEEYKATLSELNSNSKPEINALTMLAEDNKEHAVTIATCIENQLKSVPNRRKLPILYLIDSICKNYPQSIYVQLFTQNIVSNFCNVFEVSDEKVRKSLHKLRMTWNIIKIFPVKKLNAIDERVHEMDPNWPILHKISASASQNKQQTNVPQQTQQQTQPQPLPQQPQRPQMQQNPPAQRANSQNEVVGVKRATNNNSQSNGRRKRLKHNRNNQHNNNELQQQQQQQPILMVLPAPQPFIDPSIMQTSHDLQHVHPTAYLDPSITIATSEQLHQVPTANYMDTANVIIAPNEPQLQPPLPQPAQILCTPYNQTQPQQVQSQPNPQQLQQQQQENQPAHLTVLESLYGGKQCSNCSLRFDDNNRYAIHLDWHFRQNLKSDSMFARRKWYYPLNLWVQFREINDDDLQDNNNAESNVNDTLIPVNEHEVPTAPASKDDEKNICSVCHETFEKFWAEEEEEWRLRNAKLYEDESVYHPLCLMDMLQVSAGFSAGLKT